MRHALATIALLVSLVCVSDAQSQAPAWSQCGGQGWTGPTTCVSGYSCVYSNPYYSQCLPGSASSSTMTVTTTTIQPTTTTSTGPAPTGSQIRTVQDPVYHFYLQSNGGVPVLGPESSSGWFTISGSISLNNANGTKQYLNVNNSGTASYKALTLGSTASTTNWGLEGDTIIITNPRQLNFLACRSTNPSLYDVYMQQGNDTPPGKSCAMVTLHLPCLC